MDLITKESVLPLSASDNQESVDAQSTALTSPLPLSDQSDMVRSDREAESSISATSAIMDDEVRSAELATTISATAGKDGDSSLQLNPFNPENNFLLFPKLPRELRNMIWREALPPPRIHLLDLNERSRVDLYPEFCVIAPVPIVLQVNKEARVEANRLYKEVDCALPGTKGTTRDRRAITFPGTCRIDLSRDYLHILYCSSRNLSPSYKWILGAERLILDVDDLEEGIEWLDKLLTIFPALKELVLCSYHNGDCVSCWRTNPEKLQLVAFDHPANWIEEITVKETLKQFADRKLAFPHENVPPLKFALMEQVPAKNVVSHALQCRCPECISTMRMNEIESEEET